ncbi:MAG: Holliday junction resolvase RuvX [Patescibacteria group bacterium]
MRILGIDYGSKHIGLALSDPSGTIAQPHSVIANSSTTLSQIVKLVRNEQVEQIVLGDALNLARQSNDITAAVVKFKLELEQQLNLPVIWEREDLTSVEADREIVDDNSHARAASLILRNYLERRP